MIATGESPPQREFELMGVACDETARTICHGNDRKGRYELRQADLSLLVKKIAVGIVVAVVPLIIIVSVLWLTESVFKLQQ